MNIFTYIIEKKIFYLILGTIFSIISVGRFNFPLLIFIWPYCFLVYLHQNEKKLIPLILVSICLIFSNMIRWMGNYEDNILFGFLEGAYLSSIIYEMIYFVRVIPSLDFGMKQKMLLYNSIYYR